MNRLLTAAALLLISSTAAAFAAGNADYAEGQRLFAGKDYRGAAQKFEAAMKATPRDGNTIYYCALAHQMSSNRARARQLYEYVQQAFPGSRLATMAASALQQLGGAAPQSGATGGGGSSGGTSNVRVSSGGGGGSDESGSGLAANVSGPDSFTVPFSPGNNGSGCYVNCTVNGQSMRFHLDTGAHGTVIGANHMAAIGFERGAAGAKHALGGVGDRTDVKGWAQTIQLGLGPVQVRNFPVTIQDNMPGEPLLGQDFLRVFDADINPANGTVSFRKKGSRQENTYGAVDVPFTDEGTHMIVTAKVNGKPYKFYFDTGADSIALSPKDLKPLGLEIPGDAREGMSTGIAGQTRNWIFPVDSVSLGTLKKEGVNVHVVENSTMDHPLLGQDFFGAWRHKVDHEKHVIHFWPNQ